MGALGTDRLTRPDGEERRSLAWGLMVVGAVAVLGLVWSKWLPYTGKVAELAGTRAWEGTALTRVASDAPTWWQGAWAFTWAYTMAVWKAMVVGMLVAAAVDAFLPRSWLRQLLTRRGPWRGAAVAGAASMPSMMCSCCAAPVAVTLRRQDVPASSAVAYWLGNPVLNPAVLVFLALVGPWQWAGVRLAVGALLVVAASAVVAALTSRGDMTGVGGSDVGGTVPGTAVPDGRPEARAGVRRFARSLSRLCLTLLPEYAVVVLLVGAAAHLVQWDADWLSGGVLALVALAVVATLMVIPTGGEIPVLLTLAAAGASPWALGVALLALPALSLPSMVMVGRALTWRATLATGGAVLLSGLVAGGALASLA